MNPTLIEQAQGGTNTKLLTNGGQNSPLGHLPVWASIPTTAIINIDPNRTDSYTEDGSLNAPFKSLTSACTSLASTSLYALVFQIAPATWTETNITFPNVPITVYANNSSITVPTVTISKMFSIYNANITGTVVQSATTQERSLFMGGTLNGNLTINGFVESRQQLLSGGTVTVASTGQYYPIGCTFTSNITSAGTLGIEGCKHLYNGANFSIVSTAGNLSITGSLVNNPSVNASAGCINTNNGATVSNPNIITNTMTACGYTANPTVVCGTASTIMDNFSSTSLVKWSGTNVVGSIKLPVTPLTVDTQVGPTGTTSSSAVMVGMGTTITPTTTGRLIVISSGQMANSALSGGVTVDLRYGTGTPPINGAAATGTVVGTSQTISALLAGLKSGFSISGILTGQALNVPVWFDLSQVRLGGLGTSAVTGVTTSVMEI